MRVRPVWGVDTSLRLRLRLRLRLSHTHVSPPTSDIKGLVTMEETPHVLLIRRLNEPFKGRWAFPGGFVDADENCSVAVHRELREETSIDLLGEHRRHVVVPLQQVRTFGDDIARDPRGWCITLLYGSLVSPAVKQLTAAGDDAEEAAWFPVSGAPMGEMAFDQGDMIRCLVKAVSGEGEWETSQQAVPAAVRAGLRRASRVLDPAFTGGGRNPR